MAKVLFIHPVIREEDEPRHVPYGIALLAAICMERNHLVQVYDENAWRKGSSMLDEVLKADDWDVIALGGITTAYGSIKSIVRQVSNVCPDSVIVLGGGVLTSLPREIMNFLPQVDVGVVGEAFETFPALLERIDAGNKDWPRVEGTVSRGADSDLIFAPERPLIENLDVLPYPAWDLFPLEEVYFPNSQVLFSEEGMLARRRLDVNASYGCSLICRYCFHLGLTGDMRYIRNGDGKTDVAFDEPGRYTRNIRYHSPEYVVGLIRHAYKKNGVDFISFLDENLMTMDAYSKRTWLKEICRLWVDAGLQPSCVANGVRHDESCRGVHWSGTSHASLCNPEVLRAMRQAGCSHLVYGYESFSPHVMKTIGKGATPQTNIRSFFWTLEAGIRPIPNQIIGFPNEDFQSLYDNMRAWQKLGIAVKPFFATPYPGSEWFAVYREDILKQYDGDLEQYLFDLGDATRVTGVISRNFNAVELLGLRELMVNFDFKRIREYEQHWRKVHNIPDSVHSPILRKAAPVESHRRS